MKRILITSTALVVGMAVQAQAQASDFVQAVIDHFTREGYSEVEVSSDGTVVTVEALRDGFVIETVYDATTGDVLSHEVDEVDEEDEKEEEEDEDDDEDDDEEDDDDDDDDEEDDEEDDGEEDDVEEDDDDEEDDGEEDDEED